MAGLCETTGSSVHISPSLSDAVSDVRLHCAIMALSLSQLIESLCSWLKDSVVKNAERTLRAFNLRSSEACDGCSSAVPLCLNTARAVDFFETIESFSWLHRVFSYTVEAWHYPAGRYGWVAFQLQAVRRTGVLPRSINTALLLS